MVQVPYTIPGEEISCRVYCNHASYSEADLVQVHVPSSDRVAPVCKYFGECGGCQYQHINERAQRLWKRHHVEQALLRIGGFSVRAGAFSISSLPDEAAEGTISVNPTVGTEQVYGYRAKITPHFSSVGGQGSNKMHIGFQQRSSRRIIDVDTCPISVPDINLVYASLRERVRNNPTAYHRGATLLLRQCEEGVVTDPKAIVSQVVGNVRYRFKAGEFFQNNPFILHVSF